MLEKQGSVLPAQLKDELTDSISSPANDLATTHSLQGKSKRLYLHYLVGN